MYTNQKISYVLKILKRNEKIKGSTLGYKINAHNVSLFIPFHLEWSIIIINSY